jgi:hypothetical protein
MKSPTLKKCWCHWTYQWRCDVLLYTQYFLLFILKMAHQYKVFSCIISEYRVRNLIQNLWHLRNADIFELNKEGVMFYHTLNIFFFLFENVSSVSVLSCIISEYRSWNLIKNLRQLRNAGIFELSGEDVMWCFTIHLIFLFLLYHQYQVLSCIISEYRSRNLIWNLRHLRNAGIIELSDEDVMWCFTIC